MGTPIDDTEIIHGDDCLWCVPPFGSLWEVGKTPKHVYLRFSSIVRCIPAPYSPPNNRTFTLTQRDVAACQWESIGSKWSVRFSAAPLFGHDCYVHLADHMGMSYFVGWGDSCPAELHTFANRQATCVFQYAGAGGFCTLSWKEKALDLVEALILPIHSRLMLEIHLRDDLKHVYKFCNKAYGMNIKMRLDE